MGSGVARTTSGRFGGALTFNGSNGLVTIPDAASLRLTQSMTLEAWVNPSTVTQSWRDVVYKGDDNYYLMATSTMYSNAAGGASFGKYVIHGRDVQHLADRSEHMDPSWR